jgi:hypothetical protein
LLAQRLQTSVNRLPFRADATNAVRPHYSGIPGLIAQTLSKIATITNPLVKFSQAARSSQRKPAIFPVDYAGESQLLETVLAAMN